MHSSNSYFQTKNASFPSGVVACWNEIFPFKCATVSTWFANARRRLKKENKMQWSPRNRTGDEEDDKSLDSETENPQSDNNNNSNNSNNNNNNINNNNNKELRKDKRDESVDKNHIDEDETIVVDNIIGEDILMSISDRRKANNSTMTRGSGNDVTSYLACSSLSTNKHSSVAPDNHRTPSSRFQPFADPHQARVQPSATQHQKKFSQPLSMPACGNIGLSLASSLSSSSSSASSASSSLSSSFHSPSPLPPYNIFSQPPGGSNFYPHPSFMHGFTPSYCASGSGVFSSGREYNSNSGRSLFSHSYKPLTPCGTTDSSSDSSQPFLNLSVTQLPGMMPSSIEGVSKPRIWSLADVATSVVDESPAAVAAVVAPTYSASDSMFGQQQQHFAPPNSYFSISSRTTSDDPDKKTAAASLPFKGHDDGKNESLEDEYENIVMNSVDRRQNQEKSLKNQLLSPTSEDRYQQFSSCGGPYSNSYNFPFPERTFQRRQDYNVVNCSSSSSSSSFSLFPGSFFGNANSDMLQTVQGSSPTYFHATAYNDNTTLERQYREEKNKSKISIT